MKIHIPAFKAMAKCNEHLDHGPIDIDLGPDVVRVVRCEHCKHWNPVHERIEHMECDIFCGAYGRGYPTKADDFCSYGERSGEDG